MSDTSNTTFQLKSLIQAVFDRQTQRAELWRSSDYRERRERIVRLRDAVLAHRSEIVRASHEDLGRPGVETDLSETMVIVAECNHAIKHIERWMRPRRIATNLMFFGTRARVHRVPKGVALIIGPWNVPFNSILGPLVSALAAGNTAILRPSELSPASSALIQKIIKSTFSDDEVAVFEGDAEVAQALLTLPFNHIFFTGSPAIGQLVMIAASKVHASITLELGGKSPAVVDASANLKKSAANIAYAKFQNTGQACIAPDYLLVHESVAQTFLEEMKTVIAQRYGQTEQAQQACNDFGRIVNDRHYSRIKGLLDDAIASGATVEFGGGNDDSSRFIAPTVLTDCAENAKILQEEIFGPLLPVLVYRELDEAITYINQHEPPLAAYIYSRNADNIERFRQKTQSGDLGVNIALMHFAHPKLPFGGVGRSGSGKAHSEWGFMAFSHERAELREGFSNLHFVTPPYTPLIKRFVDFILRFLA